MDLLAWLFGKKQQSAVTSTADSRLRTTVHYEMIEGRRHVADAPYLLPKDDEEIDRLDFQHYILRAILKGNHLVPVQQAASILDVGCGTGRWMIEMAQASPQADVVGFDLTLPVSNAIRSQFPLNCRFLEGNVLDGLPFAAKKFDFVHQRLLVFALPVHQWLSEARELLRVTRVGGWIELVEIDIAFENMGPASARLAEWSTEVSKRRGIDTAMSHRAGEILETAGLVHVKAERLSNPIGDWGGRVGKVAAIGVQAVNKAMRQQVIAQLNVSPDEYDRALAQSLAEYDQYHSYSYAYIAYGQCRE